MWVVMSSNRKSGSGILGLRYDAKGKLLFTFTSEEDWASDDDSDDPDYPIRRHKMNYLRTRRNIGGTKHKPRRVTSTVPYQHMPVETGITSYISKTRSSFNARGSDNQNKSHSEMNKKDSCSDNNMDLELFTSVKDCRWQNSLPLEVLTKIFSYLVHEEGIVQFSTRMNRVCGTWGKAAKNSSLWKEVDFSYQPKSHTETKIIRLCKGGSLRQTEELSLSGWGSNLTFKGLEALAENCPNLISLNLNSCNTVTSECLHKIVENCPKLSRLDMSGVTKYQSKKLSPASISSLKCIIETCGERLTHLSVAENPLLNFNNFIKILAATCPNLQLLDASNVCCRLNTIFLPLEIFQHGCPRLKVLRLANNFIYLSKASESEQNDAPGFPDLEELSLAAYYGNGLCDEDLVRILKKSTKLLLLDLRGCQVFTASVLQSIPATDMGYLYISKSSIAATVDVEVSIRRWLHSLKELDLSWCMKYAIIQTCLTNFSLPCQIEKLELAGTPIDLFTIKELLCSCHSLRSLNLQSCRSLPRGMKQLFQDDDLKNLKQMIEQGQFDNFDEESEHNVLPFPKRFKSQ